MINEAKNMSEDTANMNPDDENTEQQPGPDGAIDGANPSPGVDGSLADADEPEALFEGPDHLAALEEQVADLSDKLLRAVAETENVRRRAQREKEDASKYAISGFAGDMVTVADNLSRALDSIDAETRAADEAVDNLMAGVEMTLRSLLGAFEKTGIKRIEAMDCLFDHNLHEAMFEMEDPGKPAGTVMQVIQEGYTLRDRLLRPAKVGVSKGGPKAAPATESNAQDKTDTAASEQTKAYEHGNQGTGTNLDEEM